MLLYKTTDFAMSWISDAISERKRMKVNYAVRMYRKAGFGVIDENEEEY